MNDYDLADRDWVSRQAVIDVMCELMHHWFGGDPKDEIREIKRELEKLPSAQPTLYGYNVKHLELIARVLQKENIPPERVVEALTDIGRIVAIVCDEFEENLRKAVEQCVN